MAVSGSPSSTQARSVAYRPQAGSPNTRFRQISANLLASSQVQMGVSGSRKALERRSVGSRPAGTWRSSLFRRPHRIAVGADKNLWFTESDGNGQVNWIGRITLSGALTEFKIRTPAAGPGGITAGSDGNLWFTEPGFSMTSNKIGRITPTGLITEFTAPTEHCAPVGITEGPDGSIWFAETASNKIGRISLSTCTSSATDLCLGIPGRFRTSVVWSTQETANLGSAIPITANTGAFWFFDPTNLELVVKVLDAREVNGKVWVFFGALSNVEYTLTVTDTQTGAVKTYVNPQGQLTSFADTGAF